MDSWPQTRQFRGPEHAQYRARVQIVNVREQSASAFSPCQQARRQTVRIRDLATTSIVRKQASAQNAHCPQAIRSLESATSTTSSLTGTIYKHQQAENCPKRSISISVSPLVSFPVQIRIIPTYVHV